MGTRAFVSALGGLFTAIAAALSWAVRAIFRLFSRTPHGLHTARFATEKDQSCLASRTAPPGGLLIGTNRTRILAVQPTPQRRELGNMLIVGPTRSGKGLLAVSQLLAWKHSAVVNDLKGDLYLQTAGYRATLGPVVVIDPQGIGNRYDPLATRQSEDGLYSAAASLLLTADEGDGLIFTQRAIAMLTQLFQAARLEGRPPLPYVRQLLRLGFPAVAARLSELDPQLSTQFLDGAYEQAVLSSRFLLSAWGTLTARLWPLLTETLVRCFTASDVTASELLCGARPVTVYFRWPEQHLLALSPVVRLLWNSLIGELISCYDAVAGAGCQPVLLLLDEAGRSAIPALSEHASTVVGRGLTLWIAVQSLSQLETVYGKARAQTVRDNSETMLFFRPNDLSTAEYLEHRLGAVSAYARSVTLKDGEETSEAQSERPIPLLTSQQIMQFEDCELLAFHRRLPPIRLSRMDWREQQLFVKRRNLVAPQLENLSELSAYFELPTNSSSPSRGYIDPDQRN